MRIAQLLDKKNIGQHVTVHGWIRTRRASSNVLFFELNDGSCFANLQLVFEKGVLERASAFAGTGTAVRVAGLLVESPAPKQPLELKGESMEILGEAGGDYPLQKKRHSFEFLREIAHLRPRSNTFGAVFRIRNILSWAVHQFFQERGFLYLNSPIITTSDCEGAGEMFHVSSFDLNTPPRDKAGRIQWEQDFFGKEASLAVSGQLEAEVFACSLGSCYTFGPTFRAEKSNTSHHLAEFWMVEPEIAFADLHDDMVLAEEFIQFLFQVVLQKGQEDLEFFGKRIAKGQVALLERLAQAPFHRISYTDAVTELQKVKDRFVFPCSWGADLQSEHERFLTEELFNGPVFVTDYPKDIKAFYMRLNDDNRTVAAMDCLLPQVGEIIGGSQREERLEPLRARIGELGLAEKDYWWYLDLRRYGSIPHAGFGLGFERMVQFVTGMANIRDVIPFPRTCGNAAF